MEGAFSNTCQSSALLGPSQSLNLSLTFFKLTWRATQGSVVHQSTTYPVDEGLGKLKPTGITGGGSSSCPCPPHCRQTPGRKQQGLFISKASWHSHSLSLPQDGPQLSCRILETTDTSLVDTSLVCFLFHHLLNSWFTGYLLCTHAVPGCGGRLCSLGKALLSDFWFEFQPCHC